MIIGTTDIKKKTGSAHKKRGDFRSPSGAK